MWRAYCWNRPYQKADERDSVEKEGGDQTASRWLDSRKGWLLEMDDPTSRDDKIVIQAVLSFVRFQCSRSECASNSLEALDHRQKILQRAVICLGGWGLWSAAELRIPRRPLEGIPFDVQGSRNRTSAAPNAVVSYLYNYFMYFLQPVCMFRSIFQVVDVYGDIVEDLCCGWCWRSPDRRRRAWISGWFGAWYRAWTFRQQSSPKLITCYRWASAGNKPRTR